jgi:cobalt-zinc-cadmium efflux system outer membrane protein
MLLCASNPAYAGYRDLKDQYDSYQPPLYFEDQFRSAPKTIKSISDKEFIKEIKKLELMKSDWEKVMIVGEGKKVFFRPDPLLLKSLKEADRDTGIVLEILKRPYSLEELEIIALMRNPGIKAKENSYRGSLEAFSQVAALDEILRKYTAFTEDLMLGVGPMKGKEPMKMKFPFPGILSLKSQIVNMQIVAERESLEAARRDAVTQIRTTYWNLIYAIHAKQIIADTLELLRHLESVANTRYESGKTSYQDVIKIRIKRETLEQDLITQEERQRNVESKIREILNLTPEVKIGVPIIIRAPDKVPQLKHLYDIAQEKRQEIQRFKALIHKTDLMIEMSETMILPSYTLNFSVYEDEAVKMVGTVSKKEPFADKVQATRGAGLPKMPWYGTEDAYLREARQKLLALREELKKTEAETNTMVRDAWFKLDRANRETILYKTDVVELSSSALDVSTRSYESGKLSFADVIDSYTIWLHSKLMLERNRSDLGIAWARLEQVIGVSLRQL